jgi:hypothetical protein
MTAAPLTAPLFPIVADTGKHLASTAVTAIINYVVNRLGGKKDVELAALDVASKAVAEAGQTSRHAIDAVVRIAENQRPAARQLVAPIGQTCTTLQIGQSYDGAVAIDIEMRNAIEAADPVVIGNAANFEILLSELDLENRSCKFRLRNVDNPESRTVGEITDPVLLQPNNPYSAALNSQRWLPVIAKPQLKEGDLDKLFISDIASPLSLTAS